MPAEADSTLELTQYVPLPMEEIAERAGGFLDIIEIDKEKGLVRLSKDVPHTDIPVALNQILTSLKKATALTGDAALRKPVKRTANWRLQTEFI